MNILKKINNLSKKFWKSLFFNREDRNYSNNPDEKYLFVGGFNDKLTLRIPDNYWIHTQYKPLLYGCGRELETYYKYILFTRNSRLAIYVHNKVPENQILDLLVESYRKK